MTAQNFSHNFNIKITMDLMVECWHFDNIVIMKYVWRWVLLWFEAQTSSVERQSVAAAMDSLLQVAKILPIILYDIVSASDIL